MRTANRASSIMDTSLPNPPEITADTPTTSHKLPRNTSLPPLRTENDANADEMESMRPPPPLWIDHSSSAMLNDTSPNPKIDGVFSMFLIWALIGFLLPYCFPIAFCMITKSMPNRKFAWAAFVGFCSGAVAVAGIFCIDWFVRGRPT